MKKLTVIIPAYNEEQTIATVIRHVKEADIGDLEREIIVVDDASLDATREVLNETAGLTVILHEHNRGKGSAIKTGLEAATGDVIIIQDADLEYNPNDFKALLAPIVEGKTEFVMGSRFLLEKPKFIFGGCSPFFTHFLGNKVIILLTNTLYGNSATDYEGGYKVITRRLINSLGINANGFEFDNELICKALRLRHQIIEVPIRYTPRSYKDGKQIIWRHGMRMLWTILKWRVLPL